MRAKHVTGESATVHQQDNLFAAVQRSRQLACQRSPDQFNAVGPDFLSQGDNFQTRHGNATHPAGQAQHLVATRLHVVQRLQRRRRRTQQHRNARQRGPHYRHVATVISRDRVLLVRAFVFLVDHNQTQLARRGKHGASRTDHD